METRLIFYGETFSGKRGIRIGECIYDDTPLNAIKKYCDDETHYCDMNNFEWVLWDGKKEKRIYRGKK